MLKSKTILGKNDLTKKQTDDLLDFKSGLEFDFSQWRTKKRTNYLELLGIKEKPPKTSSTHPFYYDFVKFEKYLREEGLNEYQIARVVKKQFNKTYSAQQLIDEFKADALPPSETDIERQARFFLRKKKENLSFD